MACRSFMALYAANNVCRGIAAHADRRKVRLAGLVLNCRDVPNEREVVAAFAERLGTQVVGTVPRSPVVADAERRRRTVVEAYGESDVADTYRAIARSLLAPAPPVIPARIEEEELEELYERLRDA